jgi:hypothetical protein
MSVLLNNLIEETYKRNMDNSRDYPTVLLEVLKEKHYWPDIKIKKYKNDKNLCLLHNSYKKDNVEGFKELYDECRSIVLDFSRAINNNVVISYANSIPIRTTVNNYTTVLYEPSDICYGAVDGTLISVYYHNNKWYFGSSCCPDINSSKFSHPTKTHGYMLDEVLYEIYKNNIDIADPNISSVLRDLFTSNLSPLFSYEFVLVHYENKHIIDYTKDFGENYKCLFHINTKNRITLIEEDISLKPLHYLGIKYPHRFQTPEEAIQYLTATNNSIIVKKLNKLYKISTDAILHMEEVNANNYNIWYNLLYVYMLQKSNYSVNDYIVEFGKSTEVPMETCAAINMIFTVICEILYNLYISTTNYYPKYKRFKVNMDLDKTLNPVMRFHLAQLRNQQVSIYTKAIITKDDVFNYICHSNNIKNIKKIINHIATNKIYNLPDNINETFATMSTNLSS